MKKQLATEFKHRVRGYEPCALVTGRVSTRNRVLVQFELSGNRRWFSAERVDMTP